MTEQKINPVLKQSLEFGPTIIFFVAYTWIKDDVFIFRGTEYSGFIVAALLLIPLLLVAMGILWFLTKKISRMQVFTAFMVIFFGGLTAWFNDATFFKMKTTIVYGFFAVILGGGLLRGRSYLEYVMGEFLPMQMEGWMIFTRRIVWMFLAMAVANEVIWRTQSEATWVALETFAFPVALVLFMWTQIYKLQHFLIETQESAPD